MGHPHCYVLKSQQACVVPLLWKVGWASCWSHTLPCVVVVVIVVVVLANIWVLWLCCHPLAPSAGPVACMQQNGSSGSIGSEGCGSRERQPLSSFSPIPAATTRVRRFIQERRSLPLPKVMVVFSAAGETDKPSEATSSSDPAAEEDARKPASPAPSKPLRTSVLNSQEQEVGRSASRKITAHA